MFNGLIVLILFKLIANCCANGTVNVEIKENITLTVGDTLQLHCPTSVASRINLTWFLNASIVKQGDYNAHIFDRYLIINNVSEQNEGIYSCKGTRKVIKNSATFNVKIIRSDDDNALLNSSNGFPPVFIKEYLMIPWYISRFTGQSVRFHCPHKGDPKPKIVWLKDSHPMRRFNGFVFEYLKGYILYVENLLLSDRGLYTCVVSNVHGSTNYTYQLSVISKFNHPPLFHRGKEETVYAKISDDVNLDCTFDDDFATRWIWARLWKVNNTDMNTVKKGLKVTKDGEWLYETIESDDNTTSLFLRNLTESDFGYYMCMAQNFHGASSRLILLNSLSKQKSDVYHSQTEDNKNNSFMMYMNGGAFVALIFIVLFCVRVYTKCCKSKEAIVVKAERTYVITKNVVCVKEMNSSVKPFTPQFRIEEIQKSSLPLKYDQIIVRYNIPVDIQWEVSRNRIEMKEKLGEGAFGLVFRAKLRVSDCESPTEVAIKTLKLEHRDEDVISLLQEIEIMKKVGKHENVISLLGCCLKKGPILLIMECAANGNLKNFLTKLANYPNQLTNHDFVNFAVQIASGMQHLAAKGCVHRDLATRNVLVADKNVMKISDFGLTRKLNSFGYYKVQNPDQLLPVRWMAPEAWSRNQFSTKSDVWSFGVLLWEIFTFGAQPYDSIDDIASLWSQIAKGLRLSQPDSCCDSIYELMTRCWNENASLRPDFSEIIYCLRN